VVGQECGDRVWIEVDSNFRIEKIGRIRSEIPTRNIGGGFDGVAGSTERGAGCRFGRPVTVFECYNFS
jgi:hypothetical protein